MLTSPFKDTVERSAFGVCSFLGERMKISSSTVRKYFIYTSFITMGSPIIIYLVMAFWVNIRRYIRKHSKSVWD